MFMCDYFAGRDLTVPAPHSPTTRRLDVPTQTVTKSLRSQHLNESWTPKTALRFLLLAGEASVTSGLINIFNRPDQCCRVVCDGPW